MTLRPGFASPAAMCQGAAISRNVPRAQPSGCSRLRRRRALRTGLASTAGYSTTVPTGNTSPIRSLRENIQRACGGEADAGAGWARRRCAPATHAPFMPEAVQRLPPSSHRQTIPSGIKIRVKMKIPKLSISRISGRIQALRGQSRKARRAKLSVTRQQQPAQRAQAGSRAGAVHPRRRQLHACRPCSSTAPVPSPGSGCHWHTASRDRRA